MLTNLLMLAALMAPDAGAGNDAEAVASAEPTALPRRALVLDQARQDAVGQVLIGAELPPDELAEALVELGPNHLPELLSVLIDGRLLQTGEEGERVVQLPPRMSSPVRLAIASHPRPALEALLGSIARRSPTPDEQRAALGVLGGLGERDDLDLLVLLAEPQAGATRVDRGVRRAFEESFGAFTERHPVDPLELSQVIVEAHPSLLSALLGGFEGCEPRAAVGELADLLGRIPEADPLVLAQLGELGRALPSPLPFEVTSRTRSYLGAGRPELVVEAVVVAGKLRDVEALGDLVGLASDPIAGGPAMKVLAQLSRERYRTATSWENWWLMENAWWEQYGARRIDLLATGSPAQVAEVLMEVSRKPAFRDRIAEAVAHELDRSEVDLVKLACAVLGHLRSGIPIPELEALAGHADAGVRAAAAEALEAIQPESPAASKSDRSTSRRSHTR